MNTKSTKDKIKEMFLSGQTLTSCGAAKDFITADLRKYITVLKREGMDIEDKWVASTDGKRYKEYRLRREQENNASTLIPAAPIAINTSVETTPKIKAIPAPQPAGINKEFKQQQISFNQ